MSIRFRILESNGIDLKYTFPLVQNCNYPQTQKKVTEISGFRGEGSIVISGSESSWDMVIEGKINQNNYDDIIMAQDAMEIGLPFASPLYIKIDKNLAQTSQYSFKIKRILPIVWGGSLKNGKGFLDYTVTLRATSW